METLLALTYAALCVALFKVFRIPRNKWTVPTAVLGGVVLVGALILVMNYNHPQSVVARNLYVTTPIVPSVSGRVVEVAVRPNAPVRRGDVLFRIDPEPFDAVVRQRRASLALAEQEVEELRAAVEVAKSRADQAAAERDRARTTYERFRAGFDKGASFSREQVDTRRETYNAAESAYRAARAELARIELELSAEFDGENAEVALRRAELDRARFDLDSTEVKAPGDGFVTHLALRPGMYATTLPLRPVMTFVPEDQAYYIAMFRQNAAMRLRAGYEAELIFDALPGRTFAGRVTDVLPAIGEGQVQATGALFGTDLFATTGLVPVRVEVLDDLTAFDLPLGASAQVAVYSDRMHHVALIRRILLRMKSWRNFLYLDH